MKEREVAEMADCASYVIATLVRSRKTWSRWSSWGSVLPVLVRVWPTLVTCWHSHHAGALLGVSARLSQTVIRKYVRATGEDAAEEDILQRARLLLPDLDMDAPTFEGEVEERRGRRR